MNVIRVRIMRLNSLFSVVFVIFMNVVACGCSLSFCAAQKTIICECCNGLFIFIHCIVGGPWNDLSWGIEGKVALIFLVGVSGACGHIFLFDLSAGEELLTHRLYVSSTLADNTKLFSKVVVPIYSHQQHMGISLAPYPCQHCQSL